MGRDGTGVGRDTQWELFRLAAASKFLRGWTAQWWPPLSNPSSVPPFPFRPLQPTPAQTLKARICLPPTTSPFHSRNSALARSTSSQLWMCSYFRRLEFSNFPLALPRNSGLGGWVRYHPRPRPAAAAPSRPRIENERDFAKGRGRPPLLISRSCNFKPPSLSPLAWCQLQ